MTDLTVSFLFDLDGTLVDSVYQHVLAWHEALQAEGIELSIWRIHRKIGMSGGLFTNMLFRETGLEIDASRIERLRKLHAAAYNRRAGEVRPLPGAQDLLALPDRRRHPLGDRHQRTNGNRRADPQEARGGSREDPGHHPRQGALRQAGPGSLPRRRGSDRQADRARLRRRRQRLGHARRASLPAVSASVCSPAAMARRSWSGPALTASTKTLPISSATSTRSVAGSSRGL